MAHALTTDRKRSVLPGITVSVMVMSVWFSLLNDIKSVYYEHRVWTLKRKVYGTEWCLC